MSGVVVVVVVVFEGAIEAECCRKVDGLESNAVAEQQMADVILLCQVAQCLVKDTMGASAEGCALYTVVTLSAVASFLYGFNLNQDFLPSRRTRPVRPPGSFPTSILEL